MRSDFLDCVLPQCLEEYRKLRNTARYLLGNLHDYEPTAHGVPYSELPAIDRHMLSQLAIFTREARAAYDDFQFSRVLSLLQQFTVAELSTFYLDIAKDRLYLSAASEKRRRSCQTVLAAVLEATVAVMAPILPHMAEDIWQVQSTVSHLLAPPGIAARGSGWQWMAVDDPPLSIIYANVNREN